MRLYLEVYLKLISENDRKNDSESASRGWNLCSLADREEL